MPIYEYECLSCNKVFEEMRDLKDDEATLQYSLDPCIQCLSRCKRVLSATAGYVKNTTNPVKIK